MSIPTVVRLHRLRPAALAAAAILVAQWVPGVALAAGPKAAAAKAPAELQAVQRALDREIVGNTLPLAQWQQYCDQRVPRMKSFTTAADWQAEARRLRSAVLEQVVFRGAAAGWRDAPARVQWLGEIPGGPGYRIRRVRYEAVPGLWIPALLYEPERLVGKVPAVMNVNGHVGPPGKSVPYKQIRSINQAKRGMLALNVEWLGMGQLGGDGYAHTRSNQLDLCGTAGVAVFYLSMQRGLDLLLSLEHTDPARLGVTGLSGGGWQTIFISALDPRVTLCDPVAGYSSFLTRTAHLKDLGDSEQTPCDLATVADYTHLTALLAPRAALLTFNSKDNCCFESGYALQPLLDAAGPVYRLLGRPAALRWHVNDDPGTHNYELDNRQALYRMLGDFFFPGDKSFDPQEIPSDGEIKSLKELEVELPADNADFHTLAAHLAQGLPRQPAWPTDEVGLRQWQAQQRLRLAAVVRAKDYRVDAATADEEAGPTLRTRFLRLHVGPWTVPGVELTPARAPLGGEVVLLLCDGGRRKAAAPIAPLLHDGKQVLVIDPLGVGESVVYKRAELPALQIATVGDRPLGLQASQIRAVARWLAQQHQRPTLLAFGPRMSMAALVAAALEPQSVGRVERHDALASLHEIIDGNWPLTRAPELFCFGLLEALDVPQLAALAGPREVVRAGPAGEPASQGRATTP